MTAEETVNQKLVVNDFSITVGTVNGSGSQTANLTILRALFKMGIPISGKNLFPSNIQGLPTWYTIRVSKDGIDGGGNPILTAVHQSVGGMHAGVVPVMGVDQADSPLLPNLVGAPDNVINNVYVIVVKALQRLASGGARIH